jgi:hypothetical protein
LNAVRNTDSLSDAAEQLKSAHSPFWQKADEASGGEFTNLREREKWLRNKLNSNSPVGNWDALQTELKENQQAQSDFFDKYKTTVSPQEWDTARKGYQDGIVLQNLDDLIQRNFNISRAAEARGIQQGVKRQRVFDPKASYSQQLENFYNDGPNREVLERTIGKQHMDDLLDLGLLFQNSERMDQAQNLTGNIVSGIRRHYHGLRGVLAGGAAYEAAMHVGLKAAGVGGVPILTGTASGMRRYVTERLISDPAFLKTFTYAMKNNVPARTAGPLFAARLIAGWENNKNRQQPQQPQQPQGEK